jgi:hypothetical protein
VTAHTIDPEFTKPIIEIDEERTAPVPHRYVHGRFEGTGARFSFYFPPTGQYQGRFFHNTYPTAVTSDIGPFPIKFEVATGDLGFTLDSGAYYVQTNNGGVFRAPGVDPAIAAYRANAAAAQFSRVAATRLYGEHRPFGYLFGGSGGAYQTMGAAQNTSGVWDGFVPFVPGCNHAIPSMFTVRMHALRVLRRRNCFPGICDAMDAGGSGDPYAGLNDEERAALEEVTRMGFPLRGWYGHETLDSGYFSSISGMIPMMDPSYVEDFWTQPGYLGTDPQSSIRAERLRFDTTVAKVSDGSPPRIDLADLPPWNVADSHLVLRNGAAAGASLPIAHNEDNTITLIARADPAVVAHIRVGDPVCIDNSWALALQTYHRHQLPPGEQYYGWNQFHDAAGRPLYPQREVLVGPIATANSAGSLLDGRIQGKVLALAASLDIDSFPWQADWYRSAVKAAMGAASDDNFALWFIDNAHHENPLTPLARTHAVSYGGALQQALRDLAAWVEKGVRPSDTAYTVVNSQIEVPLSAAERGGVQPVVTILANGGQRAEVAVGEPVTFVGSIDVPPRMGKVIAADWDFEASGHVREVAIDEPVERCSLAATYTYAKPGTYFAVLRGTSQREGDTRARYGRVQNVARVRIVVV